MTGWSSQCDGYHNHHLYILEQLGETLVMCPYHLFLLFIMFVRYTLNNLSLLILSDGHCLHLHSIRLIHFHFNFHCHLCILHLLCSFHLFHIRHRTL